MSCNNLENNDERCYFLKNEIRCTDLQCKSCGVYRRRIQESYEQIRKGLGESIKSSKLRFLE